MVHLVESWAERAGAFVTRFFSEVVGSVVTTACVAGATTLYIHYTAVSAPEEPRAATADIARLLAPEADKGAPAFVPAPHPEEAPKLAALPPARPKLVEKPPQPLRLADKPKMAAAAEAPSQPAPVAEPDAAFPDAAPDAGIAGDVRVPEPPAIVAGLAPREPAPVAVDRTAGHADRRLLGLPVPDMVPDNEDVARGFRGLGHAVGSLIP
jgi:hypothetical protein